MVGQAVNIKNKWSGAKKILIGVVIFLVVLVALGAMFILGFLTGKQEIIVINPLESIIAANTNEAGEIDERAIISQGVLEFDKDYINYLLVALGVGNLRKSILGYGNPVIEFVLGGEIWSSELTGGSLETQKTAVGNEDLVITISKEEAVKALISDDVEQFMKDSVSGGKTQIEMIAGNIELFSKGYLDMYSELTGGEFEAE